VRLRQPTVGYRAGLDAALLAAACDAAPGSSVLDAGCGVGAVMLAAATRRPDTRFLGIEQDESAATLAAENIQLNGLGDRVAVIAGDVTQGAARPGGPYDAILVNPPFFDSADSLRGPAPAKRQAWITTQGLAAWLTPLAAVLREGGALTLIHRADRLGDILAALAPKIGSIQIRGVHPFADVPAKRVLVRGVKTGKAPMVLRPPLVLHDRAGAKHLPEVELILRGDAALDWI